MTEQRARPPSAVAGNSTLMRTLRGAMLRPMSRRLAIAALVLLIGVAAAAFGQGRRFFGGGRFGFGRVPPIHNIPYDGRFTFVRIKYDTAPGGYWAGGRPSWVHGYPISEQNLMKIMNDVSLLDAHDTD